MKGYKIFFAALVVLLACFSCSQNPLAPLNDPSRYTGSWGSKWVIYDDILNTLGGDVILYPYDPGKTIMSITNVEDGTAYSGKKYFHFHWNGQPILWPGHPEGMEHSYGGYSLIITSKAEYYDIVQPLDLSKSTYTKITFYARGQMSSTSNFVKFEGPNGAVTNNITPNPTWTKYTITLKDLNYVKDFFKVTILTFPLNTKPGSGGWVDVDDITYEE